MSKELTKKAVEMLLKGATLVSDPCPYCKGVRVIKDGHALCVSCGKEDEEKIPVKVEEKSEPQTPLDKFEQKLKDLSEQLVQEKDLERQQKILKSINDLILIIEKLKK